MNAVYAIAPGLIAIAAALLVWRRHRYDRRARVFLALALAEVAWAIPFVLDATALTRTPAGAAAVDGFVLASGLVAAILFLHFGMAFPHARPWLRRGNFKALYLAAAIVGALPLLASALDRDAQAKAQSVFDGMLIAFGPLIAFATVAACVSVLRSYREMPPGERLGFRAPVLGVLFGMAVGMSADFLLSTLYGVSWVSNLVVHASDLLRTLANVILPLSFYMAATRYRLLERHPEDFH